MKQDYSEMILAIKEGDQRPLKEVYLKYRESFTEWAVAKFSCSMQEAADIYQDVIIAFYENIVEGKITRLRSHIRTYLFGIGRLMILQRFRDGKREGALDHEEAAILPIAREASQSFQLELSDRQQQLRQAIASLGANCRDLLILYYYRRFTTESIMNEMKYKNTDVVKSQKVRCMKALRKIMTHQFDRDVI